MLNAWANSPTQCQQIKVQKHQHQILVPDNPTLSNTVTQPDGLPPLKTSKIQQYTLQKEQIRIKILDSLAMHGDQITIACYDDLSKDKSFSQEKVSFLEAEFERLLKVEDMEPEALVDETYNLISEMSNTFNYIKTTLDARQADMQSELKQSILMSVKELEKTCLTEDQIQEHLHPVVTTINQRLLRLSLQIRETLKSLECQTTMCSEDFISQAHRIIDSRKAASARRTYDAFKQYCYVDNDFPRSTRRALGDCNCSHQLMAAKVNDWISNPKTTRQSAYDLVRQFLEARSKALEDRKTFERRYHELELQTQDEYNQAMDRLKALGQFDVYCDKMDYTLRDWKQRWEARLKFVRDYSTKLCHANSFYVACIVLMIRHLERSKQRQADLDLHLVNYFDRVVSAIEQRFQRDQDNYLAAIRKVDQAFMTIANATDAKLMSQIANQLINSMGIAVDTRRSLLSKTADGNESLYIRSLNDIALDALHFLVKGLCLNADSVNWQQRKLEGLSQVKGSTLMLDELNKVISEREHDDDETDAEVIPTEVASTKQVEDSTKSRKPSGKAQAPPAAAAVKKGAKPVRELNEQGLYMDLPDFQLDMDLDEYGKTRCFSFNNDGVLMDELLESMQGLLGDQGATDKKKTPPKKGEEPKQCAAVAQLESGTDDLELTTDKGRLNVTIKIFKDYRAPLHFLLYDFMQQEGQRMAFNAAVDDFKQKIEEWKIEYMKILTEEQNNQYDEAMKNYQAAMKEHEKKAKAIKKGEEPPEPPAEPQKPSDVTVLPNDVQAKINAVVIPEHKDWDRSNVYLHLVYELLPYEQLKQIPNTEAQYGFNERAFLEAKIEDTKVETPKISAKPTKSAKKTDPRADKKEEPQQNVDQSPELFSDSRFVKHGQGELLRNLMLDIFGAEIKESNQKYDLMSKFYIQQGASLARKSRIDQCNYRLLLQAHQQQYVQQSVIQVQALCAQRNGITQRNMEALARIINDIEIRYLHDDARFSGFSQANVPHLFEAPVEERAPSAKGKAPPKGAPAVPVNEQVMMQILQRYRIDDYVAVKYSEKDRYVRQVLLTDMFPQLYPTFRLYSDCYERYFVTNLKTGFEQPHLMHRQIVYAGNSYEYQVRKRYSRDYFPVVRALLGTLKAELEKMRTQGISWGQEGAQYDFTFADKTIANLRGEYDVKPAISVPGDYVFEAKHPCVGIYEAKLGELVMLEEDLRSAYASDMYAFKRIISRLSEAVRAGNADAIKNNDQRVGLQRETSRLAALVSGRVAAIVDQLPAIKAAIEACEGLFAKQRPEADKAVQKALSMASSVTKRPRDEVNELEYRRDVDQARKVTELAIAALKLENLYYLLGYERDVKAIWQRQPTPYVAAKEQYLQRQKAYNLYYALLLGTVYTMESLSEGFQQQSLVEMLTQVVEAVKPFSDIKGLKIYQAKNKAYVDQSQIDIGTQMREEVAQLFAKFQGLQLDLEKELDESQCVTEQDWFNFYVREMGTALEVTLGDARRQVQELVTARDTTVTQACACLCTYLTDYVQEQFAVATAKACGQLSADKDEFLREFNKRFDRLRPVLADAPETAAALATDVDTLYVQQMTSLECNLAAGTGALQRLLWFQVSFQLIPQLLFCLLPTTASGTAVSLQLNALLQAAASSVPAPDVPQGSIEQKDVKPAKGKGKPEEEAPKPISYEQPVDLTVFPAAVFEGLPAGDEDSVATQLRFIMELTNRCIAARGPILGNYAELPQAKAPEKGKTESVPYLTPVLSETPLEPVGDMEALPLARPLVGSVEPGAKPPSAKGTKKSSEAAQDAAAMPATPLYALGQAQVQLLDEAALEQARQVAGHACFCERQAAVVSLDKLGADLAVTVAGRSFQFYFQALPVAVNFMAQAATTRIIYAKVRQDLVDALQGFTEKSGNGQ